MVPPRRLTKILGFAAPLLLVAVGFNLLLGMLDDQFSPIFPADDQAGSPQNDSARALKQRIEEAEAWYRLGEVKADRPLCVIFGLSTVRDGINVDIVDQEDGAEINYLFLGGAGGSGIYDFVFEVESLIENPLRPDLVCLGIHSFMLAIPPPEGDESDRFDKEFETDEAEVDSGTFLGTEGNLWTVHRRQDFSRLVDGWQMKARQRLVEKGKDREGPFGQPPYTPKFATASEQRGLDRFEQRGWYELQTYTDNFEGSANLLFDVVARLQAKGARVVLMLMPERSFERESFPPEVRPMLVESIQARFPDDSVPVLDFSDALPDLEFADHVHANEYGRIRLSRQLAREIPRLIPAPAQHSIGGDAATSP